MGQSLTNIIVHIVFSTKYRVPLIKKSIQTDIYSYMGGILNKLECNPLIINGTENHIHILCIQSKNIALAKLVEEIKKRTSQWIKTKDASLKKFYWQDGYSAFSVSASQLDRAKSYIQNQEAHHQKRDFKTELRIFLEGSGVEYDERYLWR